MLGHPLASRTHARTRRKRRPPDGLRDGVVPARRSSRHSPKHDDSCLKDLRRFDLMAAWRRHRYPGAREPVEEVRRPPPLPAAVLLTRTGQRTAGNEYGRIPPAGRLVGRRPVRRAVRENARPGESGRASSSVPCGDGSSAGRPFPRGGVEVQLGPGVRADDAVGRELDAHLEPLHRGEGVLAELPVDVQVEGGGEEGGGGVQFASWVVIRGVRAPGVGPSTRPGWCPGCSGSPAWPRSAGRRCRRA